MREERILQMIGPRQKINPVLDRGADAFIGIGPVAWNPRGKLRDKARVVEMLLLRRAQVDLGTREPKKVAVQ